MKIRIASICAAFAVSFATFAENEVVVSKENIRSDVDGVKRVVPYVPPKVIPAVTPEVVPKVTPYLPPKKVIQKDVTSTTTTSETERKADVSFGNETDKVTIGASDNSSSTKTTTTDNLTGTSKSESSSSQGESATVGVSHKDGNTTYSGSGTVNSSTTTKDDGSTTTTSGVSLSGGQQTSDKTTNADGSTTTTTYGEKFNVGSTASSDGTGSVTYGVGENAKAETQKKYGEQGGTSGETHASGEINTGVKYTAGTTENGAAVKLEGDISVRGKVGASGQVGNDEYNVHGSGEIEVSAELVAKLQAVAEKTPDGSVKIKAGGEAGAAATLEGTIKGGITVMGVPIDVVLSGGVSVGAKASAGAGFEFDATTGMAKLTLEASAVLGAGAEGSITVEVGAEQLKELLIGKVRDIVDRVVTGALGGDQTEYIKDVLNSNGWEEMFKKIAQHELDKIGSKLSVDNLLEMIKKGGLAGDVFRFLDALKDKDHEKAMAILNKIKEDIQKATASANGPFDQDPNEGKEDGTGGNPGSGTSGSRAKPVGLTPFKVY